MFKHILSALALIFLLQGCVMYSLNPLSKENECLIEGLAGTWKDKNSEYIIQLSPDKKAYYAIERKLDAQGEPPMRRVFCIAKIGSALYASITFGENSYVPAELGPYMLKTWQIARIRLDGDKLAFQLFNDDALKKLNIPEPDYVEAAGQENNGKPLHVYGANPKQLREWLAKYGDLTFSDERAISLEREK